MATRMRDRVRLTEEEEEEEAAKAIIMESTVIVFGEETLYKD
jgi:hypothetical protein